jgi:hypothetical protein
MRASLIHVISTLFVILFDKTFSFKESEKSNYQQLIAIDYGEMEK